MIKPTSWLRRQQSPATPHFRRPAQRPPIVRLLGSLIDTLLPNHCELCHSPSHTSICEYCWSSIASLATDDRCQQCDLPLPHTAPLCAECLGSTPIFDRILCGLRYAPPINILINRFKHQRGHYIGAHLAPPLMERIEAHYQYHEALPECLIPVPLHWRKRCERGYNQSALLASYLSSAFNIPVVDAVVKTRHTAMQQGLDRKLRTRNLRGSFAIAPTFQPQPPPWQHVAIIDDVVTTSATTVEITKVLKRYGVPRVDIWALARTPR